MGEQRLHVPLDALMDTRIGTMRLIHPDWPKKIFQHGNGWYWRRFVDNFDPLFGAVGTEAFRSAYKNRDLTTLKTSFETNLVSELRKIIAGTDALIGKDPEVDSSSVIVNFYPYVMPDEQADKLLQIIKSRICPWDEKLQDIAFDAAFSRCWVAPEDLTFDYIRDNSEVIFMYDFEEWHRHHALSVRDDVIGAPRNQIIFPAMFHLKEPAPEDMQWPDGKPADPWELATQTYATHARLVFWPSSYFSIFKVSR